MVHIFYTSLAEKQNGASGEAANVSHLRSELFGGRAGASSEQIVEDPSVVKVSGNSRPADTTLFVDDANIVERDMSHTTHIDNTFLDLQDTDSITQDIISFLAKPIVLATGSFATTDTYSFFNSYALPYAAFGTSQGIVWTQKLAGIFGIRMDMRLRIVTNANRFQQGRYMMGWVPLAGGLSSPSFFKEQAYNNTHMATLVQRTTVPHVEFDLSTDTSAELLIPYVSARNFYEMNNILSSLNNYSLGYLNIYPYSPLVSPAGSTTAGYTIYISFENVKLFGAASAQSGLSNREVSNKVNGPISGPALSISKGFKEFANIPMLSSYAAPVAWVADRIVGVASVFGWSKPLQGDSLTKFELLQAPGHTNVDGDSDARTLSYLSKPGVTQLAGVSGTDYDEMDFSYIVRKPAYFNKTTWTTSNVYGDTILSFNVTPAMALTIGGAQHFQPVAFVASLFTLWRGSLRYRLKFVRTEFHSGRIQIAFYPTTLTTSYTGNAAYVHRLIVDIRETSEVDFVVPYISATAFTPTNYSIGTVLVTCLDPLVAPATVSSSITLLFEVAGGIDMEFSNPASAAYTPTMFTPQSGNIDRLTVTNIGSSRVSADSILNHSVAIGDKVSSFRSYLKRFHPIITNDTSSTSTTTAVLNTGRVGVLVDTIYAYSATPGTSYWRGDVTGFVASCYAVWRGGTRHRFAINKNFFTTTATMVNSPSMAKVIGYPNTGTGLSTSLIANATGANISPNYHVMIQDLANNAVITCETPQYSGTVCRSNYDAFVFQGVAGYGTANALDGSLTKQQAMLALPISISGTATGSTNQALVSIYRSLADDADFGLFISVPAMISDGSTNTLLAFY